MDDTSQLQAMMREQQNKGSPDSAPLSAPMSSVVPKEGDNMMAKNQVTIAMQMLEQALLSLGTNTEDGRLVMDVLMKLSKNFHKESNEELMPAQLMSMMQGMPQVGGGNPEQMALMKAQQQPQQPQGGMSPPTM
jgi:hypothetical protein